MKVLIVTRFKKQFASHILPFVEEQANAIAAQGHEIDYFLVHGEGLKAYFLSRKPLLKKIKQFRPDIIHAHYGLSGFAAVLQHKVPVVITFHNGETLGFAQNLISSLATLRAKHVIYVAQHIYDKAYIKKKKHHSIMPCGVNLNEMPIQDFQQARTKCGFSPDKKYILFGGAFDNLRKNYPLLKDGISRLNDINILSIEMKGLSRSQLNDLMFACDAFALPSKSEGSPQALKEAMACGCPIIATDIADIKHLLGNLPGHYICSFEPENVAEQIKKALAFASRTKGRDRIIELGLTNNQIAIQLIDIYNHIISSK